LQLEGLLQFGAMRLSPEQIYEKIVLNHFNYQLQEAGEEPLKDLSDLFKTTKLILLFEAVDMPIANASALIQNPKLPEDHAVNMKVLAEAVNSIAPDAFGKLLAYL
jgi:hypothetical protein